MLKNHTKTLAHISKPVFVVICFIGNNHLSKHLKAVLGCVFLVAMNVEHFLKCCLGLGTFSFENILLNSVEHFFSGSFIFLLFRFVGFFFCFCCSLILDINSLRCRASKGFLLLSRLTIYLTEPFLYVIKFLKTHKLQVFSS